ncbi:MAG: Mu transposase domain-containing protein, partial [Nocardioides sp.]
MIAQRVGWVRSLTVLKDRVRVLRPMYLPPDPASRTTYVAGERVQCDLWFPPVDIPVGHGHVGRPPVLVVAAGYSRMLFATMIPSRRAPDLIAGHWLPLGVHLGAVPRELVWANESAVGSWQAGQPKLTEDFEGFRGTLGMEVRQGRPGEPEAKGIVERGNQYLETSFLPGRAFTSPADFDTQLWAWLPIANGRVVRRIGCTPTARWETDKTAMLTLPPVAPLIGWRIRVRLPRDHYVRVDSNDYSVHPGVVGRGRAHRGRRADLATVAVTCAGTVVATHARCWDRQKSITDPVHHQAALELAHRAAHHPRTSSNDQVEQRDLSVYDAAFGITEDV